MIGLLTTARKATVAAAVAFLSPPTALLLSDQPITWRVMGAALLVGLIGGLTTYETGNTRPPQHAASKDT